VVGIVLGNQRRREVARDRAGIGQVALAQTNVPDFIVGRAINQVGSPSTGSAQSVIWGNIVGMHDIRTIHPERYAFRWSRPNRRY